MRVVGTGTVRAANGKAGVHASVDKKTLRKKQVTKKREHLY